nr:crossover junction endodeoxyribonuclease RuvC [Egibacter rhizosphaerae]
MLGVDPGLSRCGLGVIDGTAQRAVLRRAGVVRTAPGDPTASRLADLHRAVRDLIAEERPEAVVVERLFVHANLRTVMSVGQATGVAMLAGAEAGLEVAEYTPTEVKAAISGHGGAEKSQVAYMVRAVLGLAETPEPPDVADALALALCHLRRGIVDLAADGTDQGRAGAGQPAASGDAAGGLSPRLAAAVANAGPGAQVTRPSRGRGAGAPLDDATPGEEASA